MQKQLLAVRAIVPALVAAMAAHTRLLTDRVCRGMAAANGKPAMRPVHRLLPLYKPTANSGVTEE